MNLKKPLKGFGLILLLLIQSCSDEVAPSAIQNNASERAADQLTSFIPEEAVAPITDPQDVAQFLTTGIFGNKLNLSNSANPIAELLFEPSSLLPLQGKAFFSYQFGSQNIQWTGDYQVQPSGKISIELKRNFNPPLPTFSLTLQCYGMNSAYKELRVLHYSGTPAEISSLSTSFDYFFTYDRETIKSAMMNTAFKMGTYSRPGKSESRVHVISFTKNGEVTWRDVDGTFTGTYEINQAVVIIKLTVGAGEVRGFRTRLRTENGSIEKWETLSVSGFKNVYVDSGLAWRMITPPIALDNTLWESINGEGVYIFGSTVTQNGASGPFTYLPDGSFPDNYQPGTYFRDPECPFITRVELENGCKIFFVRPGGFGDPVGGHTAIYANEWCNPIDNTPTTYYRFRENI